MILREYTYGDRGDVREISSHTGGVDHIIEGKVINKRGRLQQKGERLDDGLVEAHKRPNTNSLKT